MRKIQGYNIEFGFEFLKRTLFFEIYPFKWRMPYCAVPNGQPAMATSPHLYFGPFHFWYFGSGTHIGLTFEFQNNQFIQDKLTCPHGMKRIF